MQFETKLAIAATVGVASHQCIFITGEWHMAAPRVLKLHLFFSLAIFLGETLSLDSMSAQAVAGHSLAIILAYGFALASSMVLYRVFLHRLRKFPGPFWASVSKLWHVRMCIQTSSQNHLVLDDLNKKYGDFVRTGPSEITIFHPDVFHKTDGPGNSCGKAVWYDFLLPEVAINTTRNKKQHDQRRRIWDHGFNTKALLQYNDRISVYVAMLEAHIAKIAETGDIFDATEWFYWFSFDVMGDFAFAKSFEMLRDERWHHTVIMLRRAMGLLGPLSPVPWLAQIGFDLIPNFWVVKDWFSMMNWCKKRMSERIEMTPEVPDVSSHLIDASINNNSLEKDMNWLNGDAIAIIIAGSDTVAPTLVFIFYELARNPVQADLLAKELHNIDTSNQTILQSLPHLNGIINEALRIHPPVPSGGYRETPPEGLYIAGKFIPGNTTLVAPRYTIGRRADCFMEPNEFIPQRWYSKPEMVINKKAFAPFSQGRYSCVGKNLALTELRYVTALLAQKYEIHFAPGETGYKVTKDMKDQFTAAPGSLKLVFKLRIL